MSIDIETQINSIKSLTIKPINDKLIRLINCIDNMTDYILHLEVDTYPVKVITDFNKYCFAESPIDQLELNKFNMSMVFKSKVVDIILYELSKVVDIDETKKRNTVDCFHIFQKIEEFTKYQIDYQLLENAFGAINDKTKNNQINSKIPKDLLLSSHQISKLVLNEIKTVNRNKDHLHYIIPDTTNPFILTIRFRFDPMSEIGSKMRIINDRFKYDYVELKLVIDSKAHPYIPPKIEYVKPKVKQPLLLSIINLEVLRLDNWHPTITLDYLITKLGEQLQKNASEYIITDTEGYTELEYELIKLANVTKEHGSDRAIIEIKNINNHKLTQSSKSDSKYWKSGTGYGNDSLNTWDIKSYIAEQEIQKTELSKCLLKINSHVTETNMELLNDSVLFSYLVNQVRGINLLEVEKNNEIYVEIFKILENLADKKISQEFINGIGVGLKNLFDEIKLLFETSTNSLENESMLQIYCIIEYYLAKYQETPKEVAIDLTDLKDRYCQEMKPLQFGTFDIPQNHRFIKCKGEKPNQKALMRILSEISSFKTSLPLNWESTIWVRIPKDGLNVFSFLISGPRDTPYENGLFEFHAYFPQDYPNTVPQVLLHTTGNGTVRFNPNLYDNGKVCLSLLGTWQGQDGEKWNNKTSTFLQVLVSIQSLILVDDPYFNEPGWERQMNTPAGKTASALYNEERQPSTIKLAMTDMIRSPPKGFEEVVKTHFAMKKEEIIKRTEVWLQNSGKFKGVMEKNRNELLKALSEI